MSDQTVIVREFLAASERGDRAVMYSLLHPDFVVHEAPSLPYGGTHHGLDGYLKLVRSVFTSFRDTRVEIDSILGENDTVIVLARLSGRSKCGRVPFVMPLSEVWRLVDGRIRSVTPYYFDTARINEIAGTA